MSEATPTRPKRPEFRNINVFHDVRTYRLPLAGWVSILHRVSGAVLFLLLPLLLWLFDTSVSSELSFARFAQVFSTGVGIFPGWIVRLMVLAMVWGYLHHLFAGIRYFYLDATHRTTKTFGRQSAATVLALSLGLTVILGAKVFGLY